MARIVFERRDLSDDSRRWLSSLDRNDRDWQQTPSECVPPIDVIESAEAVEVVVDLPGVAPDVVTVTFRAGALVIAGVKQPTSCQHGHAAFHLAERNFGRFNRTIRFSGALETSRATATLEAGELHVRIPRIAERRNQEIRIPVGTES